MNRDDGPSHRRLLGAAALLCTFALGACGGARPEAQAPKLDLQGQSKCSVKGGTRRPLIVEWPSADRGALEASAKKGVVAVRYVGCEMEVLRQCKVPSSYVYTPVTRKEDQVSIRNTDELYATIPVHAASFEGKLASSGRLDVAMTIVGGYEAERTSVRVDELTGLCEGATHLIAGITAGAFEFTASAASSAGAAASGLGAEAGGELSQEKETLNRDGYRSACERATGSDTAPPDGCGALRRVEVVPLQPSAGVPGAAVAAAPTNLTGSELPLLPEPPPSWQRTSGHVALAAGGAGLLLGTVTGFMMIGEDSSLSSVCRDAVCPPSSADDVESYRTLGTLTSIGFLGGAGLIGASIVLYSIAPGPGEEASAGETRAVVGPSGFALEGSF